MSSFADPGTHYTLIIRDVPVGHDDCRVERVVAIMCDCCERRAANIDSIPHENDCEQRFARSDWFRGKVRAD